MDSPLDAVTHTLISSSFPTVEDSAATVICVPDAFVRIPQNTTPPTTAQRVNTAAHIIEMVFLLILMVLLLPLLTVDSKGVCFLVSVAGLTNNFNNIFARTQFVIACSGYD